MTLQDKLIFRPMLLILLVQLMGFSISATAEVGSNHVKGDNEEQGQEETKAQRKLFESIHPSQLSRPFDSRFIICPRFHTSDISEKSGLLTD